MDDFHAPRAARPAVSRPRAQTGAHNQLIMAEFARSGNPWAPVRGSPSFGEPVRDVVRAFRTSVQGAAGPGSVSIRASGEIALSFSTMPGKTDSM